MTIRLDLLGGLAIFRLSSLLRKGLNHGTQVGRMIRPNAQPLIHALMVHMIKCFSSLYFASTRGRRRRNWRNFSSLLLIRLCDDYGDGGGDGQCILEKKRRAMLA